MYFQVSIEMDRFLVQLKVGDNYFKRESSRSPFITKSPLPLGELQDRLLKVLNFLLENSRTDYSRYSIFYGRTPE